MSEIKGSSPSSHLAHLTEEVNKHCTLPSSNTDETVPETSIKTWLISLTKPPYIYFVLLPIIIFILIIYIKPGFVKRQVRVADDNNDIKYVTDFKKLMISTIIISVILCAALYYFVLRKSLV